MEQWQCASSSTVHFWNNEICLMNLFLPRNDHRLKNHHIFWHFLTFFLLLLHDIVSMYLSCNEWFFQNMLLTICQISSIVAIELKLLFFNAIQLAADVFPLNHAVDTLFNFHRIDSNLAFITASIGFCIGLKTVFHNDFSDRFKTLVSVLASKFSTWPLVQVVSKFFLVYETHIVF